MNISEKSKLLASAGLQVHRERIFNPENKEVEFPETLLHLILEFMGKRSRNRGEHLYLAMYDIRSNKVRTLVAKFFERKGFRRIQKSVYLANLNQRSYSEVVMDIKEMNELYDNNDSFIFIPINDQIVAQSHFIGKELDLQLLTAPPRDLVL